MRGTRWLLLAMLAAAANAAGQDTLPGSAQTPASAYPVRPVRLLVPYPAGGPVDAVARMLAPQLGLGQTVIVDNRSGAGGSLGADVVAKAPPDGYTMLIGNTGPMSLNPVLQPGLPYDSRKDFAPVSWLTSGQMVLVVHPSLPVRSVKELVALARANPGRLNYGSSGVGNTTHLAMELLQSMTKVKINHIPYKGAAPSYTELMAGQIDAVFGNITGPLGYIQSGRLRAIAVSGPVRSPVLPQVPRIAETYPGFELVTWMGIFLPGRTPEPIRLKLQNEFNRVVQVKEVRERLVALGNDVIGGKGEEMAAHIDQELKLYAKIIKSAGIRPE
jgi:tripartite-type tricarboxylate transporter receptor subunit TctC